MSLQTCNDMADAIALESSLGLFLKPISKIKINVQLPKLKMPGLSISSWNVMEKLKATVRPDQFISLKSLKITANVIKLEGELENKASCERAVARLRAAGSLKLSGFADNLQMRAAHAPCSFPTRHDWEAFYRDAKGVNEMKPGERPDTVHLQDIPVRWFTSSSKSLKPSEKVLRKAFGGFGRIRRLEIPTADSDSTTETVFAKKSSLHSELLFDVYIQYEEYVEFSIAMDSLRGKKLVYKDTEGKTYSADIKVDFDRTNYLSEKRIKQRAAVSKSNTEAESAKQKCDASIPNPVPGPLVPTVIESEKSSPPNFNESEAKSLLKELLIRAEKSERIKEEKVPSKSSPQQPAQEMSKRKKDGIENEDIKREKDTKKKVKSSSEYPNLEKKKKDLLLEQERLLKEKLLRNLRLRELKKINESREKLRKKLAGCRPLKSVLAVKKS